MYVETCLVDGYGRLVGTRMNNDDIDIGRRFARSGLIKFGRIPLKEIQRLMNKGIYNRLTVPTYWVRFSDEAWEIVHKLRRERSERMLKTDIGLAMEEWMK